MLKKYFRKKCLLLFILSLYFLLIFIYNKRDTNQLNFHGVEVLTCKIPKLNPNSAFILNLNKKQTFEAKIPPCVGAKFKFSIDINSNLILTNEADLFWTNSICFYQGYRRDMYKQDFNYIMGPIKIISQNSVPLEDENEYISVWCYDKENYSKHHFPAKNRSHVIYEDHLIHVPLKSAVQSRPPLIETLQNSRMSVLVLGMDTTSHNNFVRYMPKSFEFLKKKMAAFEFTAFNSLGWETYDSFIPLITGHTPSDLRSYCPFWRSRTWFLDSCPFVWNEFKKRAYITSYYDEEKEGPQPFRTPPFDYDYRHFIRIKHNQTIIGHGQGKKGAKECFGPRLTYQVHLNLMKQVAHKFRQSAVPYFHFGWTQMMTHELNEFCSLGDDLLLDTLKELIDRQLLNNTALIIVGDHGMRHGVPRAESAQGFFEERQPILLIALPAQFRQDHPTAIKNLEGNQNKFITALDLHATFRDFTQLNELTDELILKKNYEGERQSLNGQPVSLFLPVSPHRKCSSIPQLDPAFCSCLNEVKYTNIDVNSPKVRILGENVVVEINSRLKGQQCHQVSLSEVREVKLYKNWFDSHSRPRFSYKERLHLADMKKWMGDLYEIIVDTTQGKSFHCYAMQGAGTEFKAAKWEFLDLEQLNSQDSSCNLN